MTPARSASADPPARGCFAGVDFARGRLFDTSDVDEAREVCGRVFNPHRLDLVGRGQALAARMDHLPLGPLSLNRLTWGARVRVDPERLGGYGLISLPVRGAARFDLGGREVEVTARQACLVGATERFRFEADAAFDQIVLRFERAALEQAWTALSGRPAPAEPLPGTALPLAGRTWQALEPVLDRLCACARGDYPREVLPHVQARLHELLLTTLLLHGAEALTRPERAARVPPTAALVDRAQAWMLERLAEPVTVGGVARACGVATRTLQAAFQTRCGLGPMQWLREQRLEAVHRRLREAPQTSLRVTDTALAHGFTHLGEFSSAYRRRFGETPSHTLSRR